LHIQEGQDPDLLIGIGVILVVATLLFAILWTYFEHDLYGVFGVSSFLVAAVAVVAALVANRAERLG
jgi:hypothetical protein